MKPKQPKLITLKETQGNKKLNQYIEDLRRNKKFLGIIDKVRKYLAKEKWEDIEKKDIAEGKITDLFEEYIKIDEKGITILRDNPILRSFKAE